jgi:cytoskeletal protein CcmA (bactofilin family)
MFTNKGKTPEAAPALPDMPARRVAGGPTMASIIANGVKIIGSIIAEGAEVQVNGEIEGNVQGGSLTIGDTGMVKGDIVAESVTVIGRVEGSVRARKVQLSRNAHVLGDIVHQSLAVEMGAVFEGQCRYLQDPLRDDAGNAPQIAPPSAPAAAQDGVEFGAQGESRLGQGVTIVGSSN